MAGHGSVSEIDAGRGEPGPASVRASAAAGTAQSHTPGAAPSRGSPIPGEWICQGNYGCCAPPCCAAVTTLLVTCAGAMALGGAAPVLAQGSTALGPAQGEQSIVLTLSPRHGAALRALAAGGRGTAHGCQVPGHVRAHRSDRQRDRRLGR